MCAANIRIVHIDVNVALAADLKKAICALFEKAKPLHISDWTGENSHWKKKFPIDMGKVGLTSQMII